MAEDIRAIIKEVQRIVFSYDLKELNGSISKLGERLSLTARQMNQNRIKTLNEILLLVNASINNKDYLLLADILEYELWPFLSSHFNEVGGKGYESLQ